MFLEENAELLRMVTNVIKGIIVLMLVFLPGGCMAVNPENKIAKIIRKEFDNPVIREDQTPVSGLRHVSVYDKSWLVEDPLIPINYYQYENGEVFRTLPLDDIRYQPLTEAEALRIGFWFLRQIYYFDDRRSEVRKTENGFEISIWADFFLNHPMYGDDPAENRLIVIECRNGRWTVSDADIYK